jgi:hypothetical protein
MTTRSDLARNNTKIDKLRRMRDELSNGKVFSITRLTALKSIIRDKAHTDAFALYISQKTKTRIRNIKPKYIENWPEDKKLINLAAVAVSKYLSKPRQARSHELTSLLRNLEKVQEWGKNPYWAGPLRVIKNRYALILEDALRCILHRDERNRMVYEMASDYVLAFSDSYTRELTPTSLPSIDDIISFLKKISREKKVGVKKRSNKNG